MHVAQSRLQNNFSLRILYCCSPNSEGAFYERKTRARIIHIVRKVFFFDEEIAAFRSCSVIVIRVEGARWRRAAARREKHDKWVLRRSNDIHTHTHTIRIGKRQKLLASEFSAASTAAAIVAVPKMNSMFSAACRGIVGARSEEYMVCCLLRQPSPPPLNHRSFKFMHGKYENNETKEAPQKKCAIDF